MPSGKPGGSFYIGEDGKKVYITEAERMQSEANRDRVYSESAAQIEQLREQILGQIEINEDLISRLPSFNDHTGYLIVRRVIDLFASFLFLPVGLILVVIFGVLIKLETNGPVFFVQKRIGRSGKPFLLFKLRTMLPDEQGSASFASQNVHRITRIGRIARRC